MSRHLLLVLLVSSLVANGRFGIAQVPPDPGYEYLDYPITSPQCNGDGESTMLCYETEIAIKGAVSMSLWFGQSALGPGSRIEIRGSNDQQPELVTSADLRYPLASVFHAGDSVNLRLYVGPEDVGALLAVEGVVVGYPLVLPPDERTEDQYLCGEDDRERGYDPAVGRLVLYSDGDGGRQVFFCTAWVLSNGVLVSARHCLNDTVALANVEFNVPPSVVSPDGYTVTIQHPTDPADTYGVDLASLVDSGRTVPGDDWATFSCYRSPLIRQSLFMRPLSSGSADWVQVLGYGSHGICREGVPPGTPCEIYKYSPLHKAQQTREGPGFSQEPINGGMRIRFSVDAATSDSGGAVLVNGSRLALGILKGSADVPLGGWGDCPVQGTGFANEALMEAIDDFPSRDEFDVIEYTDAEFPPDANPIPTGSLSQPWRSIGEALLNAPGVPVGYRLRILAVRGTYIEPGLVLGTPTTIEAPVGQVVITGGGAAFESGELN